MSTVIITGGAKEKYGIISNCYNSSEDILAKNEHLTREDLVEIYKAGNLKQAEGKLVSRYVRFCLTHSNRNKWNDKNWTGSYPIV
jgi:hypothetical protein